MLDRSRHSGCMKGLISHQDPAAELFFASTFAAAAACSAGKAIAWLVSSLSSHFKRDEQSDSCLTAVTPTTSTTQLLQALLAVVSCARHEPLRLCTCGIPNPKLCTTSS